MKVVHLCLGSFYPDNYAYQENLLPKFHKEIGCEVEVIASTQGFDKFGKVCFLQNTGTYQNEYDIKVTRLPYKSENRIWKKLKRYKGTYTALESAVPDILFVHGGQFLDVDQVVKYLKKHPEVTVYVDNHADFYNSATNWVSRNILHKIIWRRAEQRIEPYTRKFYGVLPVRVDFLKEVYRLPPEKCELLVMGADDGLVEKARKDGSRKRVRDMYGICDDDFLVVTGGKIDARKIQTVYLMQAVHAIQRENVRLVVFGSVTQELEARIRELTDGVKVQYAGCLDSKESYAYFEAADLVVFPGHHSVMWEQAAGQGKPMLVKEWEGAQHVDVGGNVRFLKEAGADEIRREIERLADNPSEYAKMKAVAENIGMKTFSYKEIARRAIEADKLTL